MALITVLGIILVLSLLAVLVIALAGKEMILSRNQRIATDAFYVADGGAMVARRAGITLVQDLSNANTVAGGTAALATILSNLYANGVATNQNPIKLLDYAGFLNTSSACCATIPTGATSATASFTYIVNTPPANYPTEWLQADTGTDVLMALGDGTYVARITIARRLVTSAQYPGGVYIEQAGSPSFPTYTFHFTYTITSRGTALASPRRVQLTNNFDAVISPQSFANYAYFNGGMFGTKPPPGTCNVGRGWFDSSYTFNGPAHTNERFWLAFSPTFGDVVESANYTFKVSGGNCVPNAQGAQGLEHYWENGSPQNVNDYCSPSSPGCTMDNPTYAKGPASFNRLSSLINMPPDAFSQQRAALGGDPNNTNPVTNTEINTDLGLCGSPPCNNPPPQGVYLPNNGASPTATLTGGIYIQDPNLKRLTFALDGSDRQVVQFNLTGGGNKSYTILIDLAANQTTETYKQGGNTTVTTYNGVPNGMIYASGNIAAFGGRAIGTGYTCPADAGDTGYGTLGSCIQQNNQWTVTAQGDVTIDNHIRYEIDPRGADGTWDNEAGGNDDNMNVKNILGLFTATGNINIADPAPNNIVIDAFLMTAQGMYQVIDYNTRPAQGNANILGGKIVMWEGYEGTMNGKGQIASGYGLNLSFDQRTTAGTALPPYFPLTQQYAASFPGLTNKPSWAELI